MTSNPRPTFRPAAWLAFAALGWVPLAANATSLELRSILLDDQGVMFSIHNSSTGEAFWLSPDRPYLGIDVVEFDPWSGSLVLDDHGRRLTLRLPDNLIAQPSATGVDAVPDGPRISEVELIRTQIERLKKLPEVHPLRPHLLRAAENRLAGALAAPTATDAVAEGDDPSKAETTDHRGQAKRRFFIAGGRKRNAVNSRVHASDHIAEYGPAANVQN